MSGDGFREGLARRDGNGVVFICERFPGFDRQKLFRMHTSKKLPVIQPNANNAIGVKIQEPDRQFGICCSGKREITQCSLYENQMRGDGNLVYPTRRGFRKESAYVQKIRMI